MSNLAVIGIGSNIDAGQNIHRAFSCLQNRFKVLKKTGVIKTFPVGIVGQPDFLNAAVLLRTDLSRYSLVNELKSLEDEMGRDRTRAKFGPREIDLDIVVWNGQIVDEDYYSRDFLQQLVAEITGKT